MRTASFPTPQAPASLLAPILVGGAVAGAFDLIEAFISFGPDNPHIIAAGLIGLHASRSGGVLTWILGVLLHFTIAISAAAVYCLSSRRLPFLRDNWLVCGMFFGMGLFLVMNLVVLPLCAFHYTGPYQYRGLLQGILVHMTIIGLPVSYSLHKLAR